MFTLYSITRAFYEAIRLQLIQDERLVEYSLYQTAREYETAKTTLATTLKAQGKTVIEVYKPAEFRKEGELKGSRISIELNSIERGDIGTKNKTYRVKNDEEGTSYTEKRLPSYTSSLEFEVTTFATTSNDDFYLIEFLDRVFNNGKGSLYAILQDGTNTVSKFDYECTMGLKLDNDDSGAIRRYMRFEVKNIYIIQDYIVSENIVPFSTFGMDLLPYFQVSFDINIDEDGNPYPTPGPLPTPIDDCATYEILLENESSKFVNHQLGYFPLIQVMDSEGNSVVGDIIVIDEDRFTVSLKIPITGKIIFGKLTTLYDSGFYNTII